MIVDDDATNQNLSLYKLRALGINNIIQENSGESALKKLKSEKVDMIIADWRMEPMTGIELFNSLKKDDALKNIPFILLTAVGNKERIVQAMEGGIKNYMIKPLDDEQLNAKLTRLLHLEN